MRQILSEKPSEGEVRQLKSVDMITYLNGIMEGPVILLDSSGPAPNNAIFSLGAVAWQEPRGELARHFCGISVEGDLRRLGKDASGHVGEALGLAITVGTLAP